jgi:hypothetical protein
MRLKYVVLRTHGGLGNQLFQVLFARLLAEHEGRELREIHDRRYSHAFERSSTVATAGAPNRWQRMLSAARVPKLLQRFFGRAEAPWRLGRSVYLDSYFQQAMPYTVFSSQAIARHLQQLADELDLRPADLDVCLVHLRMGDFFADRAAAKAHLLARLLAVPDGARLMTNDEALLGEPEVESAMAARNLSLISTQGMAAEGVLLNMARYTRIDANDSTLTFWSSVLGGCEVHLRDEGLRACRELFVRCRAADHIEAHA